MSQEKNKKNAPAIRLALLDDHQIVIDGMKLLLASSTRYVMAAEANTAEDLLQQLPGSHIDILITDITIPGGMNGFDLALKIKQTYPGIRVLALSMSEEGGMIERMIDVAKVDGFIPKASGQAELYKALEIIHEGGRYFSPSILLQYEQYNKLRKDNESIRLTSRELQIIGCIAKHYSNKQIADELFISERTVETHRKNIYRKTQTKGEASLIEFINLHKLLS